MEKHFVTFLSLKPFVPSIMEKVIPSWDVELAMEMAHDVSVANGAAPYGFTFHTRARQPDEMDSRITEHSPTYYLGGIVETYEEIVARDVEEEEILRYNMQLAKATHRIINTNGGFMEASLVEGDVVLDWKPRTPEAQ